MMNTINGKRDRLSKGFVMLATTIIFLSFLSIPKANSWGAGYVLHYTLDNCDATDSGGKGNDGELHGNPQCISGVSGNALLLDGVNDWININKIFSFHNFTVSMWIKTSSNKRQALLSMADGQKHGRTGVGIGMLNGNDLEIGYRAVEDGDKCEIHAKNYNLADNEWHLVTVVRDTSKATGYLYIDGKLAGTCLDPAPDKNIPAQSYTKIGYGSYLREEMIFSGAFDDIRIYNFPLSGDEVIGLYNGEEPTIPSNSPPTLNSFSANPTSGEAPLTVNFTCSGHDSDGYVSYYRVDFGDGDSETTSSGTTYHTYNYEGLYTATCVAVDDEGYESSPRSVTITVSSSSNSPPTLNSFSANPTSGEAPLTVNFTCSGHDSDGYVSYYRVDFGDGDSETTSSGTTYHTYNYEGLYTATCVAVDDEGYESSPKTVFVDVGNLANPVQKISVGDKIREEVKEKEWKYYKITVDKPIVIVLVNLTDDVDLYVKKNDKPSDKNYDCKSTEGETHPEACKIEVSRETEIFIGVYGYKKGKYTLQSYYSTGNSNKILELTGSNEEVWSKTVYGEIKNGEDENTYKIIIDTSREKLPDQIGYLKVYTIPFNTYDTDVKGALLSEDEKKEIKKDDDGGEGHQFKITQLVKAEGKDRVAYSLKVSGYNNAVTGPYILITEFYHDTIGDRIDSPTVKVINLKENHHVRVSINLDSALDFPGDQDWFKLEIPSKGRLVAQTISKSKHYPDTDTIMVLYDENGSKLEENDDMVKVGIHRHLAHGSYIDINLEKGGTYYLQIIGFKDTIGRYSLYVWFDSGTHVIGNKVWVEAKHILGGFGDHTYVKAQKDSQEEAICGCFGSDTGGDKLDGTETDGKIDLTTIDFMANMFPCAWPYRSSALGILYGIVGVCHNRANRALYYTGKTVSNARGNFFIVGIYGTYGALDTNKEELGEFLLSDIITHMIFGPAEKLKTIIQIINKIGMHPIFGMDKCLEAAPDWQGDNFVGGSGTKEIPTSPPSARKRSLSAQEIALYEKYFGNPKRGIRGMITKDMNREKRAELTQQYLDELLVLLTKGTMPSISDEKIDKLLKIRREFSTIKAAVDVMAILAASGEIENIGSEDIPTLYSAFFSEYAKAFKKVLTKEEYEKITGLKYDEPVNINTFSLE